MACSENVEHRQTMTDTLDQSDIDALLAAADSGVITIPSPLTDSEPRIFSRRRKPVDPSEIHEYDFKRPERVSKDQMRALHTLHESFARNFGAGLSGFMRMIVEVKVASCEQITYGEFVAALPNPTSFHLLEAEPLQGRICLELSPLIIFPIIDRLLGGNNEELYVPARPLTAIEIRLVSKITERATNAMRDAWDDVAKLNFRTVETESNPQLVQIVPPNEVAVVVGFEIRMPNRAGTMHLCIPYKVIEPVMEKLNSQSWFASGRGAAQNGYSDQISGLLAGAPVDISGVLAETSIHLRDLLTLEPGDILTTEKPAGDPILFCVGGQKKFLAHIGQHKGARALRVIRAITAADRV